MPTLAFQTNTGIRGIRPPTVKRKFINRTGGALVKGKIAALDLALSATEATTFDVYAEDSGFANVVAVAAGHINHGILVMCLETSLADNAEGEFLLCGIVPDGYIIKSSGNVAAGDPLYPVASSANLNADGQAAGARVIGKALEAATGPSTAVAKKVWFDGINPFGQYYAS